MTIDFDRQIIEVANKLDHAEGYLACEKIIIQNIKMQLDNGITDENIIQYLEKLATWFHKMIEDKQGKADYTNYRYAAGFTATLLKMPYWKSWMKTIDN